MPPLFAFIGAGNMGAAMAQACLDKALCPPQRLLLIDPHADQLAPFKSQGCLTLTGITPLAGLAENLVLAVKPQASAQVMAELAPHTGPNQVIISIMAGVTIGAIQQALGQQRVVRVMPNTPARIGLGMNAYYGHPSTQGRLAATVALLEACGAALQLKDEAMIDCATAVSGSGPAYVYYLAEHWMAAAVQLGFTDDEAATLVRQTLLGATRLWETSRQSPQALRQAVTSKGGTTEAALARLDERGVGQAIREAVNRAQERARELGGKR